MVTCEGCQAVLEAEECEMHFGRFWCPPCELTLMESHDNEYRNSEDEWNDLYDAEADAYMSQWDDDPNPYHGDYDDAFADSWDDYDDD